MELWRNVQRKLEGDVVIVVELLEGDFNACIDLIHADDRTLYGPIMFQRVGHGQGRHESGIFNADTCWYKELAKTVHLSSGVNVAYNRKLDCFSSCWWSSWFLQFYNFIAEKVHRIIVAIPQTSWQFKIWRPLMVGTQQHFTSLQNIVLHLKGSILCYMNFWGARNLGIFQKFLADLFRTHASKKKASRLLRSFKISTIFLEVL